MYINKKSTTISITAVLIGEAIRKKNKVEKSTNSDLTEVVSSIRKPLINEK